MARSDAPAEHSPLGADWTCSESTAPLTVLEEGFARLAAFESTGDAADENRARDAFRCVADGESSSKWAFLGLGLLETHLELAPDAALEFRALERAARVMFGRTSGDRAREWLQKALDADPTLAEAAVAIGELALRSRNVEHLDEARSILESVRQSGGGTVSSSVTLAEVENALGMTEEARATLDGLPETDPLVLRARAEALLRTPGMEERGGETYFRGLEQLTPDAAESYFDDVRPIADSAEIDRWEEAEFAEQRELLREFWDMRAASSVMPVSDRLAEHYRRLAVADSIYYNPEWHKSTPTVDLFPFRQSGRYDARGDIYARHGEPDQVVHTFGEREKFECWIYHPRAAWSNRTRIIRFKGSGRGFSLHLEADCATAKDYMDRLERTNWYRTARRTDTHQPTFERAIPFGHQLYTFAESDDRSAVVAALAIPTDMLHADSAEGRVEYSVDASFIVYDTIARSVERADTTFRFATDSLLEAGQVVRLYMEVAAAPSEDASYRVRVHNTADPEHGQAYGGDRPVAAFPAEGLSMSDVALADPREGGSWSRGEIRLALLGAPDIETEEFTLFYEVYDLPEGTPYRTSIDIEPVEEGLSRVTSWIFGGRDSEAITFEGSAEPSADGVVREVRRVDPGLEPGRYRMRVTIRDLRSGAETSAMRVISLGSGEN